MSFITYTRGCGKLSLGQVKLVQWTPLQAQGTTTREAFHYAESEVNTVPKKLAA